MQVYHSNRLEVLARELTRAVASEPAEPLTPERIVVPHQTMGRWLQLEIARKLGVAANLRLQLPAGFAWEILRKVTPDLPKGQPFSPGNLRWHLFELLAEPASAEGATELHRFLADGDERKRFELAERLAQVFDRCLNFRDDWIREWEQGASPHWQARLWQLLTAKVSEPHWVTALAGFRQKLASGVRAEDLPRRAFLFGISALSPSYLQWLEGLASRVELHVFLFNPSSEYWSDLRPEREIRRRAGHDDPQAQHFEEGNRLLAAWGRAGRFAFESLVAQQEQEHSLFRQPDETSQLAALQADIQQVRDPGTASGTTIPAPDHSIQVHCCHSPMREAEVLHDRLLDVLDRHPDIEPADILILTPEVKRYGALVAAVFDAAGQIPVVQSRFQTADSPTARALFDLLSLPGSRYGAESVLAPLDALSLRARFGLKESSLPAIRGWIEQAGIRRGIAPNADGQAPAMAGNTWREGLQRLLMGYAAGDVGQLVCDIAPCSIRSEGGFEAGNEDFATLGRFLAYCQAAFALDEHVKVTRNAQGWGRFLRRFLSQFFDDGSARAAYDDFAAMDAVAGEFQEVSRLLEDFSAEASRIDCPIPFEVVRQALQEAATGPAAGAARLGDGVSIGRLATGQVLPAKVVCVVGMDGNLFPRNPPRHTFDLVEQDSRPGDRELRHEDRFAFLEALLAARTAFIVSYTGRDQQDDSDIPPSVLVDELVDYLAIRFPAGERRPKTRQNQAPPRCPLRHPLQPFSRRYFDDRDPALFSYSQTMLKASQALTRQDRAPRRFATKLPPPEPARRQVTLDELQRFFADPAKGFLQHRLGIRLREAEQGVEEVEALQLNPLERWSLRQRIGSLTGGLETVVPNSPETWVSDPDAIQSLLLADGSLPHGSYGELVFSEAMAKVTNFRWQLITYGDLLTQEPVSLTRNIGEFQLTFETPPMGRDHHGDNYFLYYRDSGLRTRHRIEIHLLQLALLEAGYGDLFCEVVHRAKDLYVGTRVGMPNVEREAILPWLEAWWQGLAEPLRLFPESSMLWAEGVARMHEPSTVMSKKVLPRWWGSQYSPIPGESEEKANQLIWGLEREQDLFDKTFEETAERLLLPLCKGESR